MVNNQCYVCNNIVTFETNGVIRDKYYNIIGNKLYPGSHLCFICTHMTQKLWSFRNTCLNRGVDVQYGCEEELNWSLLFRLTKDGEKPHNLEISNVRLTIICPEIKCQANESVPINIESLDHDIIQELCINEDILPVHNVHDNYFNDFDHYVNHSTIITESIDNRHNSIDSSFDDLNHENYFLEVNNIQKVDYFSNNDIYDNTTKDNDSYENSNVHFEETNVSQDIVDENEDFRESSEEIEKEVVPTVLPEYSEINQDIHDPEIKQDDSNELVDNEIHVKEEKHNFTKITLPLKEQKEILENHRKEKKYIEAEYKCHSCALSFLFKDSYQSHMVRHEESNGQYSCSLCGLRFATANARRMHTPLHSERYVCSLCNDVLPPVRRKKHMIECWRMKIDPVACHLCGKMFQDSSGLQQHLKRFHQSKEKKRNYTCNTCGKTYNDQGALRTHLM